MNSTAATQAQISYLSALAAKGHKPAKRLLQQAERGVTITRDAASRTIDNCKR